MPEEVLTIGGGSVSLNGALFYYAPHKGWDRGSFRGFGKVPPAGHPKLAHHSGSHSGSGKEPSNNAAGRPILVRNKEGESFELAVRDVYLPLADTLAHPPPQDLLALPELHHSVLMHALRERHAETVCYTFLGSLLVYLNPFQFTIPHYSSSLIDEYLKAPGADVHEGVAGEKLLPHPWSIAHRVFFDMRASRKNQSIIVSGESGSGKTEATKIVMHYLCCLSADLAGVDRPPNPQHPGSAGGPAGSPVMQSKSSANFTSSDASAEFAAKQSALARLIEKVNASNPILETFGNAKTIRNDNSSRFGKLLEVQFSSSGEIGAMRISPFLLEKSRCVSAAAEERCYHSFYQLMAGASDQMRNDLKLKSVRDFPMLSRGGSVQVQGMNDAKEFEATCDAFIAMGFSKDERDFVWRVVAAVLHISTINFVAEQEKAGADVRPSSGFASSARAMFETKSKENSSGGPIRSSQTQASNASREDPSLQLPAVLSPASVSTVEFVAEKLLKVETKEFMRLLTVSTAYVKGDEVVKVLTRVKAAEQRDTLCKYLYSSLFYWIIDKVNAATNEASSSGHSGGGGFVAANSISILDIFGFEDFQTGNSLEQLCINLANEALQRHYSKHVFERDSEEISAEGVTADMAKFVDNEPCVQLIMGAKASLFSMLEDSASLDLDRGQTDPNLKFLDKITQKHKPDFHTSKAASSKSVMDREVNTLTTPSDFFARAKLDGDSFTVKHFASDVKYRVESFIEKNIDSLRDTMKGVLLNSDDQLVQELLAIGASSVDPMDASQSVSSASPLSPRVGGGSSFRPGGAAGGKPIGRSIGIVAQFRKSLMDLLSTLDNTHPNWIRCIRPHPKKAPKLFDPKTVLEQLMATGVLETITQRQRNFPFRIDIANFVHRFGVICAGAAAFKRMGRSGGAGLHEKCTAILQSASVGTRGGAQIGKTKAFLRTENLNKLERVRQERVAVHSTALQRFASAYLSRKERRYLQCEASQKKIKRWYRRWRYVRKLKAEFLAELIKSKRARDEAERQKLMEIEAGERALVHNQEKQERRPVAAQHHDGLMPLLQNAVVHLVKVEPSFRDKAARVEYNERVALISREHADRKAAAARTRAREEEEARAFERAIEELAVEVNASRAELRAEERGERSELAEYWRPLHADINRLAERIRSLNRHRDTMVEKLRADAERERQRIADAEQRRIASEARLWNTLAGPAAAQHDVEELLALGIPEAEVERQMKRFFLSGAPSQMLHSGGPVAHAAAASAGSSSSAIDVGRRTAITHADYARKVRTDYEMSLHAGRASRLPDQNRFDAARLAISDHHQSRQQQEQQNKSAIDAARISSKAKDYAKFVKSVATGEKPPQALYRDPQPALPTRGGTTGGSTAAGGASSTSAFTNRRPPPLDGAQLGSPATPRVDSDTDFAKYVAGSPKKNVGFVPEAAGFTCRRV